MESLELAESQTQGWLNAELTNVQTCTSHLQRKQILKIIYDCQEVLSRRVNGFYEVVMLRNQFLVEQQPGPGNNYICRCPELM